MCMLTIHSSIINFSFCASQLNRHTKPLHIEEDEEEGICTYMENGILVERKLNNEMNPTLETDLKQKW